MSLESAISDLVNSTNTLNSNVQNTLSTVNSQISSLNSKIASYGINLYVGPGKQFTDLQAAISYATNSILPIGGIINIILSPGTYNLSSINSNEYKINITGNTTTPENYVINSSAITLNNVYINFSGVTLTDSNASGTNGSFIISSFRCNIQFNSVNFIITKTLYYMFFSPRPDSSVKLSGNINITNNTSNSLKYFAIFCGGILYLDGPNSINVNGVSSNSYLFYADTNSVINHYYSDYGTTFNITNVTTIFRINNNSKLNFFSLSITQNYITINATNCSNLAVITNNSTANIYKVSGTFNTATTNPLVTVSNNSTLYLYNCDVNSTGVSNSQLAKVSNNSTLYLYNNNFKDFTTGIYAEINSTVDARTANTFTNVTNQFNPPTPYTYGNNNSVVLA